MAEKDYGPEVRTIYVSDGPDRRDRFIVSLVVGYCEDDGVTSPEQAAAAALGLTRNEGSNGTTWFVHDRQTGKTHVFEQDEFEEIEVD